MRLKDLKNELMLLGEEIGRDLGKVIYTLLYIKLINNKDLMCNTGNSAQ